VEVLTAERGDAAPAVERRGGVLVRRFPMRPASDAYPVAPALFRYLHRHAGRYDLVHGHSYHATAALALLRAGGTPTVLTPHYHGEGHTPLARALHHVYRPFGRRLVAAATAVVCVSDAEAALVRRDFAGVDGRLHVIPNGVDVAPIQAAAPFTPAGRTLLAVGRLEPYKGTLGVVEALPLLPPDVTLRVVGTGPAATELEARAAALGVAQRVQLLGRVDDGELARWYRTADAYVSLSQREAFGLTLLEAAGGGAPVVASDIPAHREVARMLPGVTLVRVGAHAAAVAAALQGALGQRTSEPPELPSWDEIAARTLDLYSRIVHTAKAA
jgi:glycosyltransferase involved in cell wall biosynthesis